MRGLRLSLALLLVLGGTAAGLLLTSGSASATIQCAAGDITLVTAPSVSASAPNINSTGGTWTSCGMSLTGYYKEWLRDGVVIPGTQVYVATAPSTFSYAVQQADRDHAIKSGVQPCNIEGCYGSYVLSSNSVTPTVSTDWFNGDGGDSGSVTVVSQAEAMGTSWPSADMSADGFGSTDITQTEGASSANVSCRYYKASAKRGIAVYYRAVWQHTYWCQKNSLPHDITYRRTRTTMSAGTFCGVDYKDSWKLDGGVGYDYLDVHSEGAVTCTTIWPFTLHSVCKLNVKYNWTAGYWTHRECSA